MKTDGAITRQCDGWWMQVMCESSQAAGDLDVQTVVAAVGDSGRSDGDCRSNQRQLRRAKTDNITAQDVALRASTGIGDASTDDR